VRVIGEREGLEPDILSLLDEAEELTRANTNLLLVVAFNYGARDEIARAVRRIAADVASGAVKPDAITEEMIGQHLDAPEIADPDLAGVVARLKRRGGRSRLLAFQDDAGWHPLSAEDINADVRYFKTQYGDVDRAGFSEQFVSFTRLTGGVVLRF